MRSILVFSLLLLLGGKGQAQFPGLSLPPSGDNQQASVTQFVGPVKVTIDYSSPKVHAPDGTDRRGKIWGQLVPYGLTNLGFGHGKPAPWRAGANENTVFSVSHPVKVQGKPLPAGRYGLHIIAGKDEWTVVFSKNSTSWGSFFYEPSEDALRITAKPVKHDYREWLTYEFTERRPTKATVELQWEDLAAAWTIEVDQVDELYISRLREELRTVPGFNWQAWVNAAQYAVQINSHLDEGLEWAEAAISRAFVGVANYATLSTKAQVLAKLGRSEESEKLMQTALKHPSTTSLQIHQYGRMLLQGGKSKEALQVFQYNQQRNGDAWPVHVGLARGYAATGENAKALEHARKALPQAPDPINKTSLENMIKTLSSGGKL
jgi:hypothetical protein